MALIYFLLILLIPDPILCEAEYYVRPSEPTNSSGSCPGVPCLTFSQYVSDMNHYFQSNTVFRFLSGTHVLEQSLTLRNIHNISLMALERKKVLQIIVYVPCTCPQNIDLQHRCHSCAGLAFLNGSYITIDSITFIPYLRLPYKHGSLSIYGLSFSHIVHLRIEQVYSWITRRRQNDIVILISTQQSKDIDLVTLTTFNGGWRVIDCESVSINNVSVTSAVQGITVFESNDITVVNATVTKGIGIELVATTNTVLNNCTIKNTSFTAIELTETYNTAISDTVIYFAGATGIRISYSTDTRIVGVSLIMSTENGIHMKDSQFTTIEESTIVHTENDGIRMEDVHNTDILRTLVKHSGCTGISAERSVNTSISKTIVSYTNCYGIYMKLSTNSFVNKARVEHSKFDNIFMQSTTNTGINSSVLHNATISGVELYQTQKSTIANTVITKSKGQGILVLQCSTIVLQSIAVKEWIIAGVSVYDTIHVYMQNASLMLNSTNTFDPKTLQSGIFVSKCWNVTITTSVFAEYPSLWITNDIKRQPAVVVLYNTKNGHLHNCSFEKNGVTALKVVSTEFTVNGSLNFTSNRAYRGAAMVFIQGSKMTLSESSHIICKNNHADATGGAIYTTSGVYGSSRIPFGSVTVYSDCFLEVEGEYSQKRLVFENNSAGQGGDLLYGGSLGSACTDPHSPYLRPGRHCDSCLHKLLDISNIESPTLSQISSDPSRVCLCTNETPDCLTVFHTAYSADKGLFPGQTMALSAVAVGQNFGTVAGSVFAQLLQDPSKNETSQLGPGQDAQSVGQHACNILHYTIFSGYGEVVLMLTAVNIKETYSVSKKSVNEATSDYTAFKRNENKAFPQDLLEFPVYVSIFLWPCPPGFTLTDQPPEMCVCIKQLNDIPGIACDIQDQTVHRSGLVWVGQVRNANCSFNGTDSEVDVAFAKYCPLNYCKNELIRVSLCQPDSQCNYEHSGTLCGGCQPGLSLALGSAQCLKCSNKYLALLIPLTLAGLLLVFFIKVLDLTIAEGLINGLVFYANMIQPNIHLYLPQNDINPLTLFIAWLNLDLGIETCFFDGLTAYWKTWLQFVFPFYIWAIAGLIILSARYSIRLARVMGNNSVPVLATLFLLSYTKLLRTIITIMSYTVVWSQHGHKTVWSADGNIDYLGPRHAPLFVAAIATLLFLWLPYTLFLFLGQWTRKINHQCITCMMMKVKPFLDAHYGPLKDKHHYWFGTLLCIRVIILLISAVVPANNFSVFNFSLSITAGALVTFTSIGPAVYHNRLTSTFEISLFVNLGLLGLAKFYTNAADGNQAAVTYTLIGVALTQFLGLVCYKIYLGLRPKYFHCCSQNDTEESETLWRYDTSLEMWGVPQKSTPYRNAVTAL